jgi:hypothetical protein
MAVDSMRRLFLTDGLTVYVVQNGVASVYLNQDLIAGVANISPGGAEIADLDVGPDDRLYLLIQAPVQGAVVVSSRTSSATLWGPLQSSSILRPGQIGVVGSTRIVFTNDEDGMWAATPTTTQQLYSSLLIGNNSICPIPPDLAVQPAGVLLYLAGCSGSPLVSGRLSGSYAGVFLQVDQLNMEAQHASDGEYLAIDSFVTVARNASGGFAVLGLGQDNSGVTSLELISMDGADPNSLDLYHFNPATSVVAHNLGRSDLFNLPSAAMDRDGTLYLVGDGKVFVAH